MLQLRTGIHMLLALQKKPQWINKIGVMLCCSNLLQGALAELVYALDWKSKKQGSTPWGTTYKWFVAQLAELPAFNQNDASFPDKYRNHRANNGNMVQWLNGSLLNYWWIFDPFSFREKKSQLWIK